MFAEGNNIRVRLTRNGIREMQSARSEYRPVYFNPSYSNYSLLDSQPIPTYFHRHFLASTFNVTFLPQPPSLPHLLTHPINRTLSSRFLMQHNTM